MFRLMGMQRFSYKKLCRVLTEEVGVKPVLGKPFYTVPPAHCMMALDLEEAGFEAVMIQSMGEEDDKLIKKKIMALAAGAISELVLVSADGGFAECVLEKAGKGVEVYIVATRLLDPKDHKSMLSYRLLNEQFHFVELARFKDSLGFDPLS